jgi:hypothetical protein
MAAGWTKGEWVLAQWKGDKYWFPGIVEKDNGASVTILYDDGTRETRPANQVKPYSWQVKSHVQCVWAQDGQWYPAVITALDDEGDKLTIRYDEDGTVEHTRTGKCRSL